MKNFTETVRNSVDIVRIVSDYVALKGSGHSFKGICPFHAEKTPSFNVHREKQIFHCFGCGVGGDVFKFVMLIERIAFPEAVQVIAEKSGIPVPTFSSGDRERDDERKILFDVYEKAAAHFSRMLSAPEARQAREVIDQRGVTEESAKKFQLGYAPQSGLLKVLRPADPVGTGLFLRNDRGETYDRFRHRLMFPIWNDRGKVIAFGGRILGEGQPKYLNSPESPLYSKSYVLYGLHLARQAAQKAGRLVVVEGYFDCLSLHQAGIDYVVASCGTSLTPQQVSILARNVPEVVMNYDPDAAGQNAMRRSIDLLLGRGLRVRILKLPGGLDPDAFVRRHGRDVYLGLLERAPYFWEYLVDEAMGAFDLTKPEAKAAAVRDVTQFIGRIQDPIERLEVAKAVADRFKVPEHAVLQQSESGSALLPLAERTIIRSAAPRKRLNLAEKQVVLALMQDPEIAEQLRVFVRKDFLKRVWAGSLLERLIESPGMSQDAILEGIEDGDLQAEVRGALLEAFGRIPVETAVASMGQLYYSDLVQEEQTIREKLKAFGSGAAPADLVRRQMEISAEKSRMKLTRGA